MTTSRDQARTHWLNQHCLSISDKSAGQPIWTTQSVACEGQESRVTIFALPGDASFRRYFRITTPEQTYLLMDAPPELEDSHDFSAIDKAYRAHDIHTPKIYAEDLTQGFLLLEDFGDGVLNSAINSANASELYRRCYEIIPHIQACQTIPGWTLPIFMDKLFDVELNNFYEWCLTRFLEYTPTTQENHLLQNTFSLLRKASGDQPQVGVHRDFHSRNLMILNNDHIGVLDFQDAVIGPLTYDLGSLLRDYYVNWSVEQVYAWVDHYYDAFIANKNISRDQFHYWFDVQGMQRHLKVLFIFTRKYLRDGSTHYLNDIFRALGYIETVCQRHSELRDFYPFFVTRLKEPLVEKIKAIMNERT